MLKYHLLFLISIFFLSLKAQINPKNIEIVRDSFGVAHIYGNTDNEVAYGLAWAHAEDDFENLQKVMALFSGRMGELTGKKGAFTDYFYHFVGAADSTEKHIHEVDPKFLSYLQAYCDGMNKFAESHPKEILLKNVFPINPAKIITGYNMILAGMVGLPDALEFVMKGKPDDFIFKPGMANEESLQNKDDQSFTGSNAFAYSKNKTSDSKTWLIVNPHIPLDDMINWYEVHLCSKEGLNILGALFPMAASPGMGFNPNLGWSLTFNWPDYVDIYKLEMNPNNKNQYKLDGKWVDLQIKKAPLKVKTGIGKISIKKDVYSSLHGPVFKTDQGFFAFRYGAKCPWRAGEQWFKMAKANNLEEFKKAVEIQAIPLFNVIYADKKDNIMYHFMANLPNRTEGTDWQKTVDGTNSNLIWNGYLTNEQLPTVLNPDCGYVYSTNNTPFHTTGDECCYKPEDKTDLHGYCWNRANSRDLRFRELIALYPNKITPQQIFDIKNDFTYPKDGKIVTLFKRIDSLDLKKHSDLVDILAVIKKWNLVGNGENLHAAAVLVSYAYIFKKSKATLVELETGYDFGEPLLVEGIRFAKKFLLKNYGKLEVPLIEVQKINRNGNMMGIEGLPDCLRAMYSYVNEEKGILEVRGGDTYIQYVSWENEQVQAQTIVPFGTSRRKESKHYLDQMPLYAKAKLKPMTIIESQIRAKAESIYNPE